jgi:small subunit ribosomal protein S2
MSTDGTYEKLTKKEALNLERSRYKLDRNLGGIKEMPGLPRALFVADACREAIAVQEAIKLKIPVIAITDTNADPAGIDYVIPGNDDSYKSLKLFISTIADACIAGKMRRKEKGNEDMKPDTVTAGRIYDREGHVVKVETR